MIKINDLHKSYKMGSNSLHVLKGINFNVEEGELVAIMGSSGSGKSTLLNILGMLDLLDKGSYDLDGVPIKDLDETKAANYRNRASTISLPKPFQPKIYSTNIAPDKREASHPETAVITGFNAFFNPCLNTT